jgi:hypothetical protein
MPSTVGIVASGVFTPLDLNPALWLDAADTTTITESGGFVSQWNDKSGNGRNVIQGAGANQPRTGTQTQNGLNVLVFDGNDFLSGTSGITGNSAVSIFVACQVGAGSTQVVAFLGAQVSLQGIGVGFNASDVYNCFVWAGADSRTPAPVTRNVFITLTGVAEPGANNTLYFNGVGQTPAALASTNFTNVLNVGRANPLFALNGRIAELIVFPFAVTAEQRLQVDAYLNSKWAVY